MKRALQSLTLTLTIMFTAAYSCRAQNGPTQPSVTINFVQSVTPGITANCWYRSTTSTPQIPGTCSKGPVTTFTDTTASAGTTYNYWVTAQVGATESAYSVPVNVPIPAGPSAPTGLTPGIVVGSNAVHRAGDLVATVTWTH